ncbi:hypothetical protein K469DRAFT_596332, partial [Zopfia rhizophila CBS 207.26]
ILQEIILPPRTLHFTDFQIYWECYMNYSCEMHPWSDPGARSIRQPKLPLHSHSKPTYKVQVIEESSTLRIRPFTRWELFP